MIPEDIVPLILLSGERTAPNYISEGEQRRIIRNVVTQSDTMNQDGKRNALIWLFRQFLDLEFTVINRDRRFRRNLMNAFNTVQDQEKDRNFLELMNQVRRKYNL